MNAYQRTFSKLSDMNPVHLESLAISIGSTLNGLPREFFVEVVQIAEKMGPDRLAAWHRAECGL